MPILYLDWYTIHLEFIISSQTFQGKFTKIYTHKQTVHIISSTNNYFFFTINVTVYIVSLMPMLMPMKTTKRTQHLVCYFKNQLDEDDLPSNIDYEDVLFLKLIQTKTNIFHNLKVKTDMLE